MKKPVQPILNVDDSQVLMKDFEKFCLKLINDIAPHQVNDLGLLLLAATFANDMAAVTCILNSPSEKVAQYGPTAALVAVGMGYFELTKQLFEHCADWFEKGEIYDLGITYPVELAAIRNELKVLEYLLPKTPLALLNRQSRNSPLGVIPPLLIALVKCHSHESLRQVLKREPDLELRSSENHTALLQACMEGDYESARLLVEAGAKVNSVAKLERPKATAEDFASQFVEKILGVTSLETTLLQYAAASGDPRLVYLLLKAGEEVNTEYSMIGTSLMLASRAEPINPESPFFVGDYPNVVRLLLMHGADVHVRHNFSGETALFTACLSSQDDIAKQLLLAGASPYAKNNYGADCVAELTKLGIMPVEEKGTNKKLIEKKRQIKKKQEQGLRKELIEALLSGAYQTPQVQNDQKLLKLNGKNEEEDIPKAAVKAKKKKKSKKNKNKKIPLDLNKREVDSDAVTMPIVAESEMSITADLVSENVTPHPLLNNAIELDQPVLMANFIDGESSQVEQNFENNNNDPVSTVKKKPVVPPVSPVMTSMPRPIFKPDIPTGDVHQKFPLRVEGVNAVHYFVYLIPNVLNALFGSERSTILNKVWAAIKTERLLLPNSKNKSGVKCLSLQEMAILKKGFFANATHKVKPNREDTRVLLESKLSKESEKNEFHLELVGVNFNAHK